MPSPAEDLNAALRDLIDVVRTADLEAVDLDGEIAEVRSLAGRLRVHRHDGVRMQAALRWADHVEGVTRHLDEAGDAAVEEFARQTDQGPADFFPYSPVVGLLNPLSPPVRMWRVDTDVAAEIHGEARFDAAYNGPPGCVHGGVIAEVFDELLGCVCVSNGLGGFTGTLTIIYRNTTPLEHPVTLRGWHDRSEGRKVFARGELRHGETLCAEAEGIFIRSESLPGGGVTPPGG